MKNFEIKPDIEPKDKYGKAVKAILEAEKCFQALEPEDKKKFVQEYIEYKTAGLMNSRM